MFDHRLYFYLKILTEAKKKPIYSIVGPTASGKTEIGVALALRLGNAEIINCDSVQIYQGIEIATLQRILILRFGNASADADVLRLLCCLPVGGEAVTAEGRFTPPWAQ